MQQPDFGIRALEHADSTGAALALGRAALRQAETSTPDLDARVLLAHVTGSTPAAILAFPERALTGEQALAYASLVSRRIAGEPVAYLVGHREFMGLDFLTDARALIPRPETELLVEAALADLRARLERAPDRSPVVADIGTGSGAIALALAALEPRLTRIYATDVSADALALARENAERLGVSSRVSLLQGDLLEPLPEPVDVLLANLPYVSPRDASELPPDVRNYEPSLALYSPHDGLEHLERFFAQAPSRLRAGGSIGLEYGYDQRAHVESLARTTFPGATIRVGADYAGWDRYIIISTTAQDAEATK